MRRALLILGHVWTAPNTIAMWALATLTRCRWVFRGVGGMLVYDGSSSRIWRWWARRWGMTAVTVGAVVVVARPWSSVGDVQRLLVHEQRHVFQALILGPLYLPIYLLLCAHGPLHGRHWYRDHPLEVDARAAAEGAWPTP